MPSNARSDMVSLCNHQRQTFLYYLPRQAGRRSAFSSSDDCTGYAGLIREIAMTEQSELFSDSEFEQFKRENLIRFNSKIGKPDENGCWPWLGRISNGSSKNPQGGGYGRFDLRFNGWWKEVPAHRFSYEIIHGPISASLEVDHLCRHRHCVNPAHLEPVTKRINILRGNSPYAINFRKTRCPEGHPLAIPNLKIDKGPNGTIRRRCRKCANAAVARHWAGLPESVRKTKSKNHAAQNKRAFLSKSPEEQTIIRVKNNARKMATYYLHKNENR